jgi:23S rRNA (adenine2030-N6)-methyltransferase
MLSYRHAFHAGAAADVLKHSALVFCLDYMAKKEKPLLCVDTHAGAALYSLHEGYAAQNREWEGGLGKLLGSQSDLPPLLRRYLDVCFPDGFATPGVLVTPGVPTALVAPSEYPGSPTIMSRLLRPGDRLVCCELHPADYAACTSVLGSRAEVRQADGFASLKGLLPPPSRRGLVLIDPSYEVKDDYERVLKTLALALKRFATGTYIVWYPLLRETPAPDFAGRLWDLCPKNRCRAELYTADPEAAPANSPRGMYGSGLIICNPPWTLPPALEETLPVLEKLGIGNRKISHKVHKVHEGHKGN